MVGRYRAPRFPLRAMSLVEFHRALLSDSTGQEAFRRALQANVRHGDSVLDLGTGTGIHAMFACQAGASKVYAVEQDRIIKVAEDVCRRNGFGNQIEFIHSAVQDVELPEKVDVICTHMGLGETIGLIGEVRERFLKKGGVVIPGSAELFCAPLESFKAHEEICFWEFPHQGLDFSALRLIAHDSIYSRRIDVGELLGVGTRLAHLDFSEVYERPFSETVDAVVEREGICHGIGLWFIEHLSAGISLSTAPPCNLPVQLWPNLFFPLARPMGVSRGELVTITLGTDLSNWGNPWRWRVVLRGLGGEEDYRSTQSSTANQFLPSSTTQDALANYVPQLKPIGLAARFVLDSCGQNNQYLDIVKEILRRFPELFRNANEASMFVAEVVARFAS